MRACGWDEVMMYCFGFLWCLGLEAVMRNGYMLLHYSTAIMSKDIQVCFCAAGSTSVYEDLASRCAKRNYNSYLCNMHTLCAIVYHSAFLLLLFTHPLPNTRYHSKLLRLVLPAQLLPIPALLLLSPKRHLTNSNRNKQRRAPMPVHKQNRNPSHALKSVVRASHPVET